MARHPEHTAHHVAPPLSTRCNCTALREAARYAPQEYGLHLAAAGLRSTQSSILNRFKELGPTTINALTHALVMGRTTVGRNIFTMQRRRLIVVKRGEGDARRRKLHLATAGLARLEPASMVGPKRRRNSKGRGVRSRPRSLGDLLRVVVGTDLRAENT